MHGTEIEKSHDSEKNEPLKGEPARTKGTGTNRDRQNYIKTQEGMRWISGWRSRRMFGESIASFFQRLYHSADAEASYLTSSLSYIILFLPLEPSCHISDYRCSSFEISTKDPIGTSVRWGKGGCPQAHGHLSPHADVAPSLFPVSLQSIPCSSSIPPLPRIPIALALRHLCEYTVLLYQIVDIHFLCLDQ